MAYILSIETATTNCSVALSKDGKLLASKEDYNTSYSHAERLHVFIEELLVSAEVSMQELSAIAVSKGPGSYTGLRIGVSAAKGLCYALEIPLISVPTLTALAYQVQEEGLVIPMLDARRMEVYSAIFDAQHQQIRETQAQILDETSFAEELASGKVYFIGNGVEKFTEVCQHPNAVFIMDKLPSAKETSVLATAKYAQKDFEDVAYFEPYYLKDFKVG